VASPLLPLFRSLIPSWKLFDVAGELPVLEARVSLTSAPEAPWWPVLSVPSRGFFSLFLNPHGNLRLAQLTLLERLLDEVQELGPDGAGVEAGTSYRITRALTAASLPAGTPFQFRLKLGETVVLRSRLHGPEEEA